MEEADDDTLMKRGRAGDQAALLEMYQRYRPRVFGYILQMTGDSDLAGEVFAATFARHLEQLDRYQPRGEFAAYLFRVARSRLANELTARNRSHSPESFGTLDDLIAPTAADPLAALTKLELTRLLESAVTRLPPHLREVVLLRVYSGQVYATISRILDENEATLRSRMRYALEWLRKALPVDPE